MTNFNFDFLNRQADPNDLSAIVQRQGSLLQQTGQSFVRIQSLDEIAAEIGQLQYKAVDASGQLRMIMSAINLFETYGINAHFAGFDASGVPQIYLSADDGTLKAGGGNVQLSAGGIAILENVSGSFLSFYNSAGTVENFALKTATDNMQFINKLAGKSTSFLIKMTDASTPSVKWWELPADVNAAQFTIGLAANGTQLGIGGEVVIWGGKDGKETVFNDGSYDVDHRFEGATDANLLFLEGGTDRVGIGTATPTEKLDVVGNVNIPSGNTYKINGTNHGHFFYQPFPAHGISGTVALSSSSYAPLFYYGLTASPINFTLPRGGTLKNFRWNTNSAQPGTGSLVATVRVNNADSTLTATVAAGGAAQSVTDLTHTVSVNGGDAVTIRIVNNATSASAQVGGLSFELEVPTG